MSRKVKIISSLREIKDNIISDVILIGSQNITVPFRNLIILSSSDNYSDLKPLDRLLELDGTVYIVVPDNTIDISNILRYLE